MNVKIVCLLNVKENATQGGNDMDLTKRISPYVLLGEIYDSLNSTMCSDCPEAHAKTQKECDAKYLFEWRTKEMGCCTFCAKKEGHLGHHETDPEFKSLKRYFGKKYGFFDNEKKTCKLPRELRSSCCLGYTCTTMKNELVKKHGKEVLGQIHKLMEQIHNERRAEKESSLL